MQNNSDSVFTGSIPQLYEQHLVPLIFEPYAEDMAARVSQLGAARVLELAAGTGVVTRFLAGSLPSEVDIVATDLNQPMLDHAASIGTHRPVDWRQADAMQLPFADESFDVVVCQFGVMFFPDKAKAFAEARRVLRPGGTLLFNVWDTIEVNEFVTAVAGALDTMFPDDPPRFMHRGPHGYHDANVIEQDLLRGGFDRTADIQTVPKRSRAETPLSPAIGYCQGSPWRMEIEARDASALGRATEAGAAAIEKKFGPGPIEGRIQAHIVVVGR